MGYCLKFGLNKLHCTKKMKFSIKDFFIFCAVLIAVVDQRMK